LAPIPATYGRIDIGPPFLGLDLSHYSHRYGAWHKKISNIRKWQRIAQPMRNTSE
jgi:hypothetical protein